MPRDGSGVYHLPAGNPVVANTLIESAWANNTLDDIANALTGSLPRNGSAGMSAALNFGNFKGINVAPGTAGTDAVNVNQLNSAIGLANTKVLGFTAQVGGGASTGTASANKVLLYNPTTGLYQWQGPWTSFSFDITTQGAGGRDQAGVFNSQWTHLWFIYGAAAGAPKSIIISAAGPESAPTLPANYTDYAYGGPLRVGGVSSQFFPTFLRGNTYSYRTGDSADLYNGGITATPVIMNSWTVWNPPNCVSVDVVGAMAGVSDVNGSLDFGVAILYQGDGLATYNWPFRVTGTLPSTQSYVGITGVLPFKPGLNTYGYLASSTAGSGFTMSLRVTRGFFYGNGAI